MTPGPGISRTPLPKGFTAGGVNSGVRKYRPDLGIILSEEEAVCVGVYTQSESKAAPVIYCQGVLPSEHVYAIVTNSGQANAATGEEGREANWLMVKTVAQTLGCLPHQVAVASTGVIGQHLALDKILPAIPELIDRVGDTAETFATAILTTDLVPKTVTTTVALSMGEVRITGISKGSGMIHPNMATMLGYLLTDVKLPVGLAQSLVREAADVSFNMISVDGDTSTNDCVFLMANGASGVEVKTDDDFRLFKAALIECAQILAKSIARDGEGASKLIEVQIKNAPDRKLARKAARGVTVSPLIKSAIHGEDPNWGRILARLGAEGVPSQILENMSLTIQGTAVYEKDRPTDFDRLELRKKLKSDTVIITIDFRIGDENVVAWGCDLTKKYVEINTDYS